MKTVLSILLFFVFSGTMWGVTYYSTGDGAWNNVKKWSLSSTDTSQHPASIDPNGTFNIRNAMTFDAWNPGGSQINMINSSSKFIRASGLNNTGVVFTGASGIVDINGAINVLCFLASGAGSDSLVVNSHNNDISVGYVAAFAGASNKEVRLYGKNISITNTSNFDLWGNNLAYNPFICSVSASSSVTITNLYSSGTLNVNNPTGSANLTVADIKSDQTKDFTCSVDGNITVTGSAEVKKSSTFTTGGTMTLANGLQNTVAATNFTVNGNLDLTKGFNNNTKGTTTVNNGNLYVRTGTSAGKLDNATINVNNGNMYCMDAAGTTYYDLAIDNSPATIKITGGNLDIKNLTVSNSGGSKVDVSGNITTHNNGTISISGSNAKLTVGGDINTYDYKQNNSSVVTTVSGSIYASNNMNDLQGKITVGKNITFGKDLYSGNNVKLTVTGDVTTPGGGELHLNATDTVIIGGKFESGAGNLTVMVNSALTVGKSFIVNNLQSGTNNSSGTIRVGGNIVLADADSLPKPKPNAAFSNDGKIYVGGNIIADHTSLTGTNGSAMSYVTTWYKNAPASSVYILKNGGTINLNATVLPIQLISFTAKQQNASVVLSWTTASEQNNKYFIVEKSTDGTTFTSIAQLHGAGTTALTHAYQTTDNNVVSGVNYYRLRQVDEDGTETVSKVISITVATSNSAKMQLMPSVVKVGETVNCVFDASIASDVAVIDIRGVMIAEYNTNGNATIQIKTDNLQAGMYFVRLNETGEVRRFIVK